MRYTHGEKKARVSIIPVLLFGTLLLLNPFSFAAPAMAEEGRIIAVYGEAIATNPHPPGWSFLWNAKGTIGDSKGYAPLSYVEVSSGRGRKSMMYAVLDAAGAPMTNRPSHTWAVGGVGGDVSVLREKDGTARYAIASYVLPEDSKGEVWVNNGNIQNRWANNGGIVLEIYLNNERKFQVPVKKDRLPVLFQTHLGRLKKGDTIQVAVGLGDQCNKGGGRLCFVIEDYPPGENPGEPVNVYSPPMNVPSPQYGPDGRYVDYLKKHQAQCDAVISNKADLVFIGDSITARWPSELLQARYGKHRPVNLGIGGDWIQNVLWRVLHGVLGKASPKVIVLLIGTNNLGGFTPDEVAEGIGRLLRMIHEQTPASKILVLGILPRGLSVRDPLNDKVREVNAKLAPMADGKTVFFLDVGHALVEPDGTISPAVMPDRLHVATPGFVRWLDAMGPTLDNLLAGRSQENP